ncbi:probable Hydroxyacylglutathione hydrolase, mitochondrial [Zygosaccharomyces bailii]|uniref:hydroxyacylglutathione hydrolase n=1 Tax=Zygosaccharomyces bailii (strain CLIB 213 / ATCC 58445 / CBS 680 / BCRC 21525 / NBRC 1098 / NCYC 1416 / NRRL Y-2227) TaxID=1333698 RepID=A0A8J2X7R8_ZYGB2|nr:ZYBA0S03-02652g1_1 [Zygosaccharomyces bailii CLIB 213]CDH15909.1 probable Hydroxyacylglutathione hydrolase,mitochondrial [Zygosaccharomyces bailii ISA1307]SJM82830.1 probable Hydroxyacylglutathione hydrolase, mitochondrial [Zygosaccharomyces bailii]
MLRQVRNMHVKAIKMRWLTGGDNYSYLLSTQDRTKSWLIDPAEVLEVVPNLDAAERRSIQVIVNTHHHYDHSGGNVGMLAALGKDNIKPSVIGGSHTSPAVTVVPEHMQHLKLGDLEITCIRTPCHTQDSVCYHVKDPQTGEQALFSGDTLFTAGCGRFFEGTAQEMDAALNQRLLGGVGEPNWALTKVFPGHEYTKSNVKFVRKAVYPNPNMNQAFDELDKFAAENEVTTGHFSLADETQFNPFMRLDDPLVRQAVGDDGSWSRTQVMDRLRKLKNTM